MTIAVLIVLGVCLGSFINAFVWRFRRQAEIRDGLLFADINPVTAKTVKTDSNTAALSDRDKLSIARGHSMCSSCGHQLAAKDLIPVVSYVMLRGRCRYCRGPIHDTPVPEVVTPLLFVLSYIFWPLPLAPYDGRYDALGVFTFVLWLVFLVGFVILSLYDYYWRELPHDIVFPLVCLAILQVVLVATVLGGGRESALHAVYGALVCAGTFVVLYWISPKAGRDSKADAGSEADDSTIGVTDYDSAPDSDTVTAAAGLDPSKVGIGTLVFSILLGGLFGNKDSLWIGGGDITLGILLGLLVGGPANAFLLIFIASLIGTLLAIPMLAMGKATRSSHLPFGPMLMAATVIVKLFGVTLIGWYTGQIIV